MTEEDPGHEEEGPEQTPGESGPHEEPGQGPSTLPLAALERINQICHAFEDALKKQAEQPLEEYLGETVGTERSRLLRDLLHLELDYRQRRGESPTASDYDKRFPQDGELIQSVLASASEKSSSSAGLSSSVSVKDCRILDVLGEGGMGVVYLAEQRRPVRRRVALKVIKPGRDTKEVIARFESERQALALMNHPSIARVYDAGSTDQGQPYFIMEHVPGVPIAEHCDRHRLSTRERLELFVQVCDAVQHAHQKGIIHRDIKSSNVLVMFEGDSAVAKIIDFGVAKAMDQRLTEQTVFTELGQLIGTLEYMSPEQAEGTSQDIDTRTDIYSLGVLLYKLLVGTLPLESKTFRSAGYAEIQRLIREVEPPKPSTRLSSVGESSREVPKKRDTDLRRLTKEVRGDLDWITMKALEKNRTRRYASASEFAADIQRHLNDEQVLAGPPSRIYVLTKLVRRHRVPVSLVFAALTLLVVGLVANYVISESRYESLLQDVEQAIEGNDLDGARSTQAVLENDFPGRPETLLAGQRVEREEARRRHEDRVAASEKLREKSRALWREFTDARAEAERLRDEMRREYAQKEKWAPVWERDAELKAWRALIAAQERVHPLYSQALMNLHQALAEAPDGSAERDRVLQQTARIYADRFGEAEKEGGVRLSASFFQSIAVNLSPELADELSGGGVVGLQSTPSGARVYCFRYEENEGIQYPFPFRPGSEGVGGSAGIVGKPFLEVRHIRPAGPSAFRAGDRLIEIDEKVVRSRADLVGVLKTLVAGQMVKVKLSRAGEVLEVAWVPFSTSGEPGAPEKPERFTNFYQQLGLLFSGYPLEFLEQNLVGVTSNVPLQARLPRGSYLFVLRKQGYVDARFPVAMPEGERQEVVRLLRENEIPEGFVYVPAGAVATGGDENAFQSLPRDFRQVGGFFVGRHEVSMAEWRELANDPEVVERTDTKTGRMLPVSEDVVALVTATDKRIQLIPRTGRKLLWSWDQEKRRWEGVKLYHEDWGAIGISHVAAMEYARWRTRKEQSQGKPWRYRLPTDLEWERAAGGVDRRFYPWGNYLVWSFCQSLEGSEDKPMAPIGTYPYDESVFGVLDMAGSVSEHTSGRPVEGRRYFTYKGGNWNNFDDIYFRVSSRNTLLPQGRTIGAGLRLVADLLTETETGR